MNPIKISIIISTYNTANFLKECIDSIVMQTIKPIEIIIIDDGSTDDTATIIREYTEKYNNIKYLYQENTGQGIAKNSVLSLANGKYICFMDPDDKYPRVDSLEKLYEAAEKNKVQIIGGNIVINDNGKITNGYIAGDGDIFNSKNMYINTNDYYCIYGHTRYLYSTEMIKKNNIKYGEYRRYEDQILVLKALYVAGGLFELDYPVYEYRVNHKSNLYDEVVWLDIMKAFCETLKLMISQNMKTMYEHNAYKEYGKLIKEVYRWIETTDEWKKTIKDIENILDKCPWKMYEYKDIYNYTKIKNEIKKLTNILSKGNVVLYGAGRNTKKILEFYRRYYDSIEGIAVTNMVEDCILGKPIKKINDFLSQKDEINIVVTPSGEIGQEMYDYACSLGYKNVNKIDIEYVTN